MHISAVKHPWKRVGLPLFGIGLMCVCALAIPPLCFPLALVLPLILCSAQANASLWFALLITPIPVAGMLLSKTDTTLSLCLLSFPYLNLFVSLMVKKNKVELFPAILWHTAAVFAGQALWWWRMSTLMYGNLFEGLATWITNTVNSAPNATQILFFFVKGGYLSLPSQASRSLAYLVGDLVLLDPALRTEVLRSLRFLVFSNLQLLIPSLIVQLSLILGLFTALRSSRARKSHYFAPTSILHDTTGPVLDFRSIRLPRNVRTHLLLLLLGSFALRLFTGNSMEPAGAMMLTFFTTVYSLLGAATLVFMMSKKRPERVKMYGLLAAALYVVLPTVLFLLGMCDQWLNLRPTTLNHREED